MKKIDILDIKIILYYIMFFAFIILGIVFIIFSINTKNNIKNMAAGIPYEKYIEIECSSNYFEISDGNKKSIIKNGKKQEGNLEIFCRGKEKHPIEEINYLIQIPNEFISKKYTIRMLTNDSSNCKITTEYDESNNRKFVFYINMHGLGDIIINSKNNNVTIKTDEESYKKIYGCISKSKMNLSALELISKNNKWISLTANKNNFELKASGESNCDIYMENSIENATIKDVFIDNEGVKVVDDESDDKFLILKK